MVVKTTDYLTRAQVAAQFGVNPKTITRWEEDGWLKCSHKTRGGHRRYTQEEVDARKQEIKTKGRVGYVEG